MNLRSFADELERLPGGRSALVKTAVMARAIGIGGAAGAGAHLIDTVKHSLTGDPYDEPQTTMLQSAKRGAMGGAAAGLIFKLIERLGKAKG